jgi:hypothetical protein
MCAAGSHRLAVSSIALIVCLTVARQAQAQEAPPPKPTASIAGRVIGADTGRPIRNALVEILSWEVMRLPRRASTDAQGRFEFTGLAAGAYRLTANAEGYLALEFGQQRPPEPGTPIDLRDGERFDKANVSLPRGGAIEGRVLDEFGDGAPGILVQIARLQFAAGRRRLMPVGARQTARLTDDRGHFRAFGLGPGDYYVTALAGAFAQDSQVGGFAPTYYPGTKDLLQAQPVHVGFGQDAPNLIIPLVPAATARIAGIVMQRDGTPAASATVTLATSDRAGSSGFLQTATVSAADGTFTLQHVPPGSYTIQGYGRPVGSAGNLGAAEFGWLPVAVDGVDLDNVVVTVGPGTAARGRIALDRTDGPPLTPDSVHILGAPVEFDSAPVGGGPAPFRIKNDWTFELQNQSGLRAFRIDVASPSWSLKRVTVRGVDVTDKVIDFRKGDIEDVEITLTTANATLGGAVTDEKGKPAPVYTVVVFASESARWTFPSRHIAIGRPNQEGRYTVRGLPPAQYLAIALPSVDGTEYQDPELLESLRALATPIALFEGDVKTLDLKLVRR